MIFKDRAKETSTSTGTGGLTLSGASAGYQALPGGLTPFYYCVVNTEADEWEVGIGDSSGGTLTRTSVLDGTNGTSAVSFSAGVKDVFMTVPGAVFEAMPPAGTATEMTSDNTPTAIEVSLFPELPKTGGIKFLSVRYNVHAYTTAGGGTVKAWTGTLFYRDGAAVDDNPVVVVDPDTNGFTVAADVVSDVLTFTVTGHASDTTHWTITASADLALENGV